MLQLQSAVFIFVYFPLSASFSSFFPSSSSSFFLFLLPFLPVGTEICSVDPSRFRDPSGKKKKNSQAKKKREQGQLFFFFLFFFRVSSPTSWMDNTSATRQLAGRGVPCHINGLSFYYGVYLDTGVYGLTEYGVHWLIYFSFHLLYLSYLSYFLSLLLFLAFLGRGAGSPNKRALLVRRPGFFIYLSISFIWASHFTNHPLPFPIPVPHSLTQPLHTLLCLRKDTAFRVFEEYFPISFLSLSLS